MGDASDSNVCILRQGLTVVADSSECPLNPTKGSKRKPSGTGDYEPSAIEQAAGEYELHSIRGLVKAGSYTFDRKSRTLYDEENAVIGKFIDEHVSPKPLSPELLQDAWGRERVSEDPGPALATVVRSEIMEEIQDPNNAGAIFVLPSQLNGAEYPSHEKPVSVVSHYKSDNTGGPRGQLAVHPCAAQFILDNAARDERPQGINAVDSVLPVALNHMPSEGARDYGIRLRNGYLELPDCEAVDQPDVLTGLRAALHTLRVLGMEEVPACGLNATFDELCEATHRVTVLYAAAVPVDAYLNTGHLDKPFQQEVSRLIIASQYYGALRYAAARASPRQKIFLMPLGGGVFNNTKETIAGAIATAIDLCLADGIDVHASLDINVLCYKGSSAEVQKFATSLIQLGKAEHTAMLEDLKAANTKPQRVRSGGKPRRKDMDKDKDQDEVGLQESEHSILEREG